MRVKELPYLAQSPSLGALKPKFESEQFGAGTQHFPMTLLSCWLESPVQLWDSAVSSSFLNLNSHTVIVLLSYTRHCSKDFSYVS